MGTTAQPLPVSAPSDPHILPPPPIDYSQEVRFAIVMYGGVSLAIYINGVAQELFNLVRATAQNPQDPQVGLHPTDKLSSSQRVYRKLGQIIAHNQPPLYANAQQIPADAPIKTRFVVDILSGTSAGGINAVFLAKALANDQNFSLLRNLWIEEGDIGKLVNDASSIAGLQLQQQVPPKSLLNSQRMYWKLLEALNEMDKRESSTDQFGSSGEALVDELDLYTTATDIAGQVINVQLADKTVQERRHRNVFHFQYRRDEGGEPRNDFTRGNNPFLAFVARCTSAFPIAFEPMRLGYIDEVTGAFEAYEQSSYAIWRQFYRQYLQPPPLETPAPGVDTMAGRFRRTDFSDGGVLDNFPFGYAIDAIPLRDAALPVDRKLAYIEPAPTHAERDKRGDQPPSFLANGWSALSTLPRYETIREDVQRVIERNLLIERVGRIIEGLERDANACYPDGWPPPLAHDKWHNLTLKEMIETKGLAWSGYLRLRVAEVTDDLARLIARVGGIEEDTPEFQAIRKGVRCWRQHTYEANQQDGKSSENRFLGEFDYQWRLRRLKFVLARLDEIACIAPYDESNPNAPQNQRWEIIRGVAWRNAGEAVAVPTTDREHNQDREQDITRFRNKLRDIKHILNGIYADMRRKRRHTWHEDHTHDSDASAQLAAHAIDHEHMELHQAIYNLGISREQLHNLIDPLYEPPAGAPGDSRTETSVNKVLLNPLDSSPSAPYSSPTEASARADSELSTIIEQRVEKFYDDRSEEFKHFAEIVDTMIGNTLNEARLKYEKVLPRDRDTLFAGSEEPIETLAAVIAWHYFYHFDDYDMIIYPIVYATRVGDEQDPIDVFRISPEDAESLRVSTSENPKLAGTLLQNFGAFFKRGFRENDIIWGRLDGAERIITALLPNLHDKPIREQLIAEALVEIIVEDVLLKNASYQQKRAITAILDKAFKNPPTSDSHSANQYAELLKAIGGLLDPPGRPATMSARSRWTNKIIRARRTQLPAPPPIDPGAPYQWTENELGYFKRAHATTDRRLDPGETVRTVARASKVFGHMLEGYSKQQRLLESPALWVTRLALIFWSVVEVAVPDSLANLVFYHWLKLLYLFELLMIVLGALLVNQTIQQFGMVAFGITAAAHLAAAWLGDLMSETTTTLRFLKWVAIALVVLIIVLGVALIAAAFGVPWLRTTIQSLVEPSETPHNASGQLSLQWILSTTARLLLLLVILAVLLKTLWSEWQTTHS